MEFCRNNNLFSLHKNLIMYPEPLMDFLPKPVDCRYRADGMLLHKIDRAKFVDQSDGNVILVFRMAAMLLVSILSEFCLHPEREQQLKDDYVKSVRLLRRGVYQDLEKESDGGMMP